MSFPTEQKNINPNDSAHYPKFSEIHNYPNPYKNVGQRINNKKPEKKYKEPIKPKKEKDRPKTHHHHHHKNKIKVPAQNIKAPGHQYLAVPVGPPVYVPVAVKTGLMPVYTPPQQPPPMYAPYPQQPQYAYPPPPPPPPQYNYYPPNYGNNYIVIPPGYSKENLFDSVF